MGNSSSTNNATGFNKEQLTNSIGSGIQGLFDKGPAPVFNKAMYAGLGDMTKMGLNQIGAASRNPNYSRYASDTLNSFGNIAAGNEFGTNDPGYARVRQNAIDAAQTNANRSFLSSGTYGSDQHAKALGEGIANASAGLDYTNLMNDRARQERAASALPGLFQATTAPGQIQLGLGQTYDANEQAKLMAEADLFNRRNNQDYTHVAQILGLLGSGPIQNQQQRQDPTALDWLGFGLGTAGAFL